MATLSFADLRDRALPSLWDESTILTVQMQEGYSFQQLLADVQAGLTALNNSLLDMPHFAGLFAVQDEPQIEYEVGVVNGFELATEYGRPDPRRGATTGHMLPIKTYDRGLGWTMRYLQKARRAKLDVDVRSAVRDGKDLWQKTLLQRLFRMEGEAVGSVALASVPLADGGVADASYVPPKSPEGEEFTSAHDHFLRLDGISTTNVNAALEHLTEHGHESPFELWVSKTDLASWTNTANVAFKQPEYPQLIYRDSGQIRADLVDTQIYQGYIETDYGIARVIPSPRLPTAYWGVYKTYGAGDPRNPLRVRIDPVVGFGFRLVPGQWANAPIEMAVIEIEFGVGIGADRTNGVMVLNAATGDYVTPTIT